MQRPCPDACRPHSQLTPSSRLRLAGESSALASSAMTAKLACELPRRVGRRGVHALGQSECEGAQNSLGGGQSKARQKVRHGDRHCVRAFFLGHGGRNGDGRGVTRRCSPSRRPPPPVVDSSVLPPMPWSPRRSRLDSEVGASALAEGSIQFPLTPASLAAGGRENESEEGSKEEQARSWAATPSTGWPHPQARPTG
jgi:hypothetical protein